MLTTYYIHFDNALVMLKKEMLLRIIVKSGHRLRYANYILPAMCIYTSRYILSKFVNRQEPPVLRRNWESNFLAMY